MALTEDQVNDAAFAAAKYTEEEHLEYVDRRFPPPPKLFLGRSYWLIDHTDGIDDAGEMDATFAAGLYGLDLRESFSFDIKKLNKVSELFIHNVEVTVHDYKAIAPTPQGVSQNHFNNIIIVELDREDGKKLPWHFSAKYLLDDPERRAVQLWGRKQIELPTNKTRTFFVKVSAKERGIYTYTVDLLVKRGIKEPERLPLVKTRRTCAFQGGSSGADMEFDKKLHEAIYPSEATKQRHQP